MTMNDLSSILSYRVNSFSSETNFKKSCETILDKNKYLNGRTLNSILAYDDPKKPFIDDEKNTYIWYLAIGSMINPISLCLRDTKPILFYPAQCPNHRLIFRDHCGMADIESCSGEVFDGVVHLIPIEQMNRLDQVEHMYKRITVRIVDYQQRSHLVYVYKMTLIDQEERPVGTPSKRYVDIIIKGCEYFGVRSTYINRLKYEQAVIPRKSPAAYRIIDNVPDDVYYTTEELLKHDGKAPALLLWISVNGKVLEYTGLSSDEHQNRFYEFILTYFGGREVVHVTSKAWYEPMYTLPLNEDDICDEHCALAEDMCVSWGLIVVEKIINHIGNQLEDYSTHPELINYDRSFFFLMYIVNVEKMYLSK